MIDGTKYLHSCQGGCSVAHCVLADSCCSTCTDALSETLMAYVSNESEDVRHECFLANVCTKHPQKSVCSEFTEEMYSDTDI